MIHEDPESFSKEENQRFTYRAREQFRNFQAHVMAKGRIKHGRLLEIGSKSGHFLKECCNAGFEAVGTEVSQSHIAKIKNVFPDVEIWQNEIDSLPFESDSFDYVVSFQVLEHMSNPREMLRECRRVLKPGGYMYHICPNYNSFYEGHYKTVWFPFLRTRSGRAYLKLLGRSPKSFGNGIYPTRYERIRTYLQSDSRLILQSMGKTEFVRSFTPEQIQKVDQKTIQAALRLLYQLRFVSLPVLRLIAITRTYYPLTVVAQKMQR